MILFIQSVYSLFYGKITLSKWITILGLNFLWVVKNMEYILWQWVDRIYGKLAEHGHLLNRAKFWLGIVGFVVLYMYFAWHCWMVTELVKTHTSSWSWSCWWWGMYTVGLLFVKFPWLRINIVSSGLIVFVSEPYQIYDCPICYYFIMITWAMLLWGFEVVCL